MNASEASGITGADIFGKGPADGGPYFFRINLQHDGRLREAMVWIQSAIDIQWISFYLIRSNESPASFPFYRVLGVPIRHNLPSLLTKREPVEIDGVPMTVWPKASSLVTVPSFCEGSTTCTSPASLTQ